MSSKLREQIRNRALALGFARAGFADVAPLPHRDTLLRWIDRGYAAQMGFFARHPARRCQPAALLPAARSALVVAASYATEDLVPRPAPGEALVARYARGADYHHVLRQRLGRLLEQITALTGQPPLARVAVDTSPLLERELAMAAGVGFIGKNSMLISPGVGSYTVLGTLLLSLDLPPDAPARAGCGRCRLCLDACPTGALVEPYVVDSRRCISYLTIEHRGVLDPSLAQSLAPWIFGCDACQEVCPHNARAGVKGLAMDDLTAADPAAGLLQLEQLLALRSGGYRRLVRGRALSRVPRRLWQRNAALLAADPWHHSRGALLPGIRRLAEEPRAPAGEAARWALSRIISHKRGPWSNI